MKRVVIVGAGGRDFHTFNVIYRHDPKVEVVAFTAAQIPNIDHRTYPHDLAGSSYPNGIPIVPEAELESLILQQHVDEVVFAYSDVAYPDLMHLARGTGLFGLADAMQGSIHRFVPSPGRDVGSFLRSK